MRVYKDGYGFVSDPYRWYLLNTRGVPQETEILAYGESRYLYTKKVGVRI